MYTGCEMRQKFQFVHADLCGIWVELRRCYVNTLLTKTDLHSLRGIKTKMVSWPFIHCLKKEQHYIYIKDYKRGQQRGGQCFLYRCGSKSLK